LAEKGGELRGWETVPRRGHTRALSAARARARRHGGVAICQVFDRTTGHGELDGKQRDGLGLRLCLSWGVGTRVSSKVKGKSAPWR
jgi:hypothetical protein